MCTDQTTCIPEGHLRLGETMLGRIQLVGEVRVVEGGDGNRLGRQEFLLSEVMLSRDLPRDLRLLLGLAGSSAVARLLRGLDEIGNPRQQATIIGIILFFTRLRVAALLTLFVCVDGSQR